VLGVRGLAGAQDVARTCVGLGEQVADLGLREAGDVVVDPVRLDPALGQEQRELAARRARRLLVDHEVGHRPEA
jgi:hypothetical protein